MAGTLTIPNPQAGLSGNVPVIQLDNNWNAIRDYVNTREVTQGTLGSRPAPSVSGRYYFATDTAQLFLDTGTAWTWIASPSAVGLWAVRRLTGANNTVTPLTQYDVGCDAVQLRNSITGQTLMFYNPGQRTNNILTAGPAVNGRDQAGAFTANSFIHLYYITDGTTLATISSIAGPTAGPVLPGGYTNWAYIGALRLNASTQFPQIRIGGSWIYYMSPVTVLSGGASPVPAPVDISSAVPPTAVAYRIDDFGSVVTADGAGALGANLEIQLVSGTVHRFMWSVDVAGLGVGAGQRTQIGPSMDLPYLGTQFFYRWTVTAAAAVSANITVSAYQVANGSE